MRERYENPLVYRYASQEMAGNFSDDMKFRTWRKLWIALAEAEMEMGLPITADQISEMKNHQDDINYEAAEKKEREVRHDVMAHVHAFGIQCPKAKPIIHLGATSCYVGDNTDIILMTNGLRILKKKLINCIEKLAGFAEKYKEMPCLAFTHYQPAQLTTVGKRACLWIQDLLMDYEELVVQISRMHLRGVKGTTGTQASFLTLFDNDHEKVKELEERVVRKLEFEKAFPVTGQTYPRKLDSQVLNVLSSIAQSAYKFSNDIRLLQNLKEIEEPFEKEQIGSSAMAYKRNPMRSERISSLARFVISLCMNPAITASTQWFERTLDDSANKRIVIPQAFLAVDAILNIYMNIAQGLVVYPKIIENHIAEELPFMATETILMEAVKRGGDRQELHEKIRIYSMEAAKRVKMDGASNNLLLSIIGDNSFGLNTDDLKEMLDPKLFTGRANKQVQEFLNDYVEPLLNENSSFLGLSGEVRV